MNCRSAYASSSRVRGEGSCKHCGRSHRNETPRSFGGYDAAKSRMECNDALTIPLRFTTHIHGKSLYFVSRAFGLCKISRRWIYAQFRCKITRQFNCQARGSRQMADSRFLPATEKESSLFESNRKVNLSICRIARGNPTILVVLSLSETQDFSPRRNGQVNLPRSRSRFLRFSFCREISRQP